jgi:hypothetical protein
MTTEHKTEVSRLPALLAVPGLPGSAPKLDRRLVSVVRSTTRYKFTTDKQLDADPNAQAESYNYWSIPYVIEQPMIDAAKDALSEWEKYMTRAQVGPIGTPNTISEWLSQLGVLCGGPKMTIDEAKEKLAAYATGLNYPTHCFSQKSLYAAARHFKWFPTFSEVCDFLEAWVKPARQMHERIKALSLATATPEIYLVEGPAKSPYIKDLPPEQQKEYLAQLDELKKKLADSGVGNSEAAAKARREMHARDEQTREMMRPILEAKRAAFMAEGETVNGDGN